MTMDTFRLDSKFYEVIERSPLHTYHSALVFVPTQQFLYKRQRKEMTHNACWLRGGLAHWDPLIATFTHPSELRSIRFSPDSSQLASFTQKAIRLWDAMSGTPISVPNWEGSGIVLADNFS